MITVFTMVQLMRLELTRIAPLASETNAYANSATTACENSR